VARLHPKKPLEESKGRANLLHLAKWAWKCCLVELQAPVQGFIQRILAHKKEFRVMRSFAQTRLWGALGAHAKDREGPDQKSRKASFFLPNLVCHGLLEHVIGCNGCP
jgi:hypothetical protein